MDGLRGDGIQGILILIAFMVGLTWGVMSAVMAPYLKSIGYTATEYGILGSITVISGIIFTLLSGVLSDYIGAKKIYSIGLFLGGLSLLLISTMDRLWIAIGYFLLGASGSLAATASSTLVSRSISDERLHYIFSYVSASTTFGIAVGSFMGWIPVIIYKLFGFDYTYTYRLAIVSMALIRFIGSPLALLVKERRVEERRDIYNILEGFKGLGVLYWIILLEVILGFGAALSIQNIDFYFTLKFGVTSGELGSIFGIENMAMALIMIFIPNLADRFGSTVKLYILLTLSSLPLLIGMTITSSLVYVSALFIARTILMNVANPLFSAFTMKLIPSERRGVGTALFSLSWNIPASFGRAIGGYLLDIDVELPLRITAILYGISIGGLYTLLRVKRLEE